MSRLTVVGLDLGQAKDFTALAVVEATPTQREETVTDLDPEYHLPRDRIEIVEGLPLSLAVINIARLELGTSYPTIVERVGAAMRRNPGALLVLDHTGVGRPVVDLFDQAGLEPVAVTITGGEHAHGDGRVWSVPKRDLVGGLVAAFQADRLKIRAALPHAPTLTNELLNFRLKVSLTTGHDSYEAWRESVHDDLVLAVALANWAATMVYAGPREYTITVEDNYRIGTLL